MTTTTSSNPLTCVHVEGNIVSIFRLLPSFRQIRDLTHIQWLQVRLGHRKPIVHVQRSFDRRYTVLSKASFKHRLS